MTDAERTESVPLPVAFRETPLSPEAAAQLRRMTADPDYPDHAGEEMPRADKSALLAHTCNALGHARGTEALWEEFCETRRERDRLQRELSAEIVVSQQHGRCVDELLAANDALQAENADLQSQLSAVRAARDAYLAEANELRERLKGTAEFSWNRSTHRARKAAKEFVTDDTDPNG